MKSKLNEESIRFVLPKRLKNDFFRLCEMEARSPSLVLRQAVVDFVAARETEKRSRKESAPVSQN